MLTPIRIYAALLPVVDECVRLRKFERPDWPGDREDIVNVAVVRYLEHLQERTARFTKEPAQ
jgi:hypothetical protein